MSTATRSTRFRRRGAQGLTALLLATFALGGGITAAGAVDGTAEARPAAAEPREVTGGSFDWGVRQSIRNYLENFGHTGGSVAAYQGATYKKGDAFASFPVASGTVDVEAQTASLSMNGELEMLGFEDSWLHFEDVRLEIADGTATVVVDMIESYNVKSRTDDLAFATFEVPAGGLSIEDETLTLTTGAGRFTEQVGLDHLPSYGGPTYAYPNDYTDPLSLTLRFDGGEDPGEQPGGGDPGEDPDTGPYGVSAGAPLSGTSSYMRVKPGYALHADGSTEIVIEGYGFYPGPVVAPGTGSGGIYVGIGTMRDFSDPEKWRRSKGGSSGPVGLADYTYGSPRFVVNQGSPDADVADGAMDANGSWRITLTVPGPQIASFFGDTIDCLAVQCGVFSFGAHGAVNAANEAFVPIYFEGQNEDEWPDRNTDDPTPLPPDPSDPDDPGDPDDPDGPSTPPTKGEPNGSSTGTNASSGASLTVSPAYALKDSEQTVTLTGKGYPTSRDGNNRGGFYVLFGWVDPSLGDAWAPSKGGSSASSFTYAKDGLPAGSYQRMVNYAGGNAEPGSPSMDANGDWTMEFPIARSQFTSAQERQIDCYTMQCGIITIGAMGAINGGGEIFTPVYFTDTADGTGSGTPPTNTGGITANPNMQAGQNTGVGVNGGLEALARTGSEPRTLMIAGLLVTSVGLLGAALLYVRRQRPEATLA